MRIFNNRKRKKTHCIYSQEDINKVMYASPFFKIINDYISLRKSGKDYVGRCPFCKELTNNDRHFRVSTDKNLYKCFECGAGGKNAISFLMRYYDKPFDRVLSFINRNYTKIDIKHIRTRNLDYGSSIDEDLPF